MFKMCMNKRRGDFPRKVGKPPRLCSTETYFARGWLILVNERFRMASIPAL